MNKRVTDKRLFIEEIKQEFLEEDFQVYLEMFSVAETPAEEILGALNGRVPFDVMPKASRRRVTELLIAIQRVLAKELQGLPHREQFDLCWALNEKLEDYPTVHAVDLFPKSQVRFIAESLGTRPHLETALVWRIVELAKQGLIRRVRKCNCGEWFFAKRQDQKSHSPRCRHRLYENTDQFKKRHRERARWYYAMYQSPKAPKKKLTFQQWLKNQEI